MKKYYFITDKYLKTFFMGFYVSIILIFLCMRCSADISDECLRRGSDAI
jgi:hypothetical protein